MRPAAKERFARSSVDRLPLAETAESEHARQRVPRAMCLWIYGKARRGQPEPFPKPDTRLRARTAAVVLERTKRGREGPTAQDLDADVPALQRSLKRLGNEAHGNREAAGHPNRCGS